MKFFWCRSYVAVGIAAVAAACAVGAGAWPAGAGLAGGAARAAAVRSAAGVSLAVGARRTVLLITGDRVLTGPAPVVVRAEGADRAGPVVQWSVAGRHYVVPSVAVPYLGRGLDLSLFDVSAVAGLERGGVLPVRVAFSGRVPALPGVKVTRVSAGVAWGYLTAASAGRFGAALGRLFAADRVRARYGADGMFGGGVRISLAGVSPAPGVVAPPGVPMHTLTVRGTNAAGSPDTGDFAVVMNVDNPAGFGSGAGGVGSFSHGVAKFSVAAGTYWAVGVYDAGFGVSGSARPRAAGNLARMVVLPQFTVSANKTVAADARTATSAVRFLTPLPAVPQAEQINVERISPSGQALVVSVSNAVSPAEPGLSVNPVSRAPADGTLQSSSAAQLFSPPSAPSPYQYYPIVKGPKGTIPPQTFHVRASSLAMVHENLYAGAPTAGSFSEVGFLPSQPGFALDVFLSPTLRFPGRDTVYLSAVGGSAVWQGTYSPVATYFPGGQSGSWVSYRPGEVTTEDWNAYPLHTAPNVNLLGAEGTRFLVSANRSGDVLTLAFMPFSDSAYGHLGTGYTNLPATTVSGTYRIQQNGKTIASGNALNSLGIPTGEIYHQATLSPKPSVITFTLTARRTGTPFTLSTATSTTWTWRSAHESGATVPRWWYCSFAQNHDCAAQPLLMLGYRVRGLALDGAAPAGAQSLTVTVGHLQLAAAQKVTKVTVQASFDDGKTWTDAAVTGSGGSYDACFTAPARRKVTLRVTALDAAGGQVSETTTRAYATAPRPGTPR